MARPAHPRRRRVHEVRFRLSSSEKEIVRKAAHLDHSDVTEWSRRMVLSRATLILASAATAGGPA